MSDEPTTLTRDIANQGRPRNSYKRDYILDFGIGLGGGLCVTLAGVSRYVYFADLNPFITRLRAFEMLDLGLVVYNTAHTSVPTCYSPTGLSTIGPMYAFFSLL